MTRLLTCGYETGDINEAGISVIGTNGTLAVVNATPTPRAGNYCLKVASTAGSLGPTYKSLNLPAAKTDLWIRFAFFVHPVAAGEITFAYAYEAAAAPQTALTYTPTDGLLRAYRGGSVLLATASTSFAVDTWHVIEWRTQITSASAGVIEVWLDGNRVINFSGDNTNSSTLNVQSILLGQASSTSLAGTTGLYLAFDDIAINDTAGTINNGRPGDGRIVLLKPSGAGTTTQLARGGTDTGANHTQVNETPPSMAQYVGSATVGQRDLYALDNLGVAVQSINTVEVIALAMNSDAGGGFIAPTLKSGATTNEATAIGLSTSAGYVRSQWETDPNTGVAWTTTAIDSLEAGATIR